MKLPLISTKTPYDDVIKKEDFSHDVELAGNNFKVIYPNGDYEVGTAVLVPTELHVDFSF